MRHKRNQESPLAELIMIPVTMVLAIVYISLMLWLIPKIIFG